MPRSPYQVRASTHPRPDQRKVHSRSLTYRDRQCTSPVSESKQPNSEQSSRRQPCRSRQPLQRMMLCATYSKDTAIIGWTRPLLPQRLWRLSALSSKTESDNTSKTWSTGYFRSLRSVRQRLLPSEPAELIGQGSGKVEAIPVPTDDLRHPGLRLSHSSASHRGQILAPPVPLVQMPPTICNIGSKVYKGRWTTPSHPRRGPDIKHSLPRHPMGQIPLRHQHLCNLHFSRNLCRCSLRAGRAIRPVPIKHRIRVRRPSMANSNSPFLLTPWVPLRLTGKRQQPMGFLRGGGIAAIIYGTGKARFATTPTNMGTKAIERTRLLRHRCHEFSQSSTGYGPRFGEREKLKRQVHQVLPQFTSPKPPSTPPPSSPPPPTTPISTHHDA
jgi:hypothetical protein